MRRILPRLTILASVAFLALLTIGPAFAQTGQPGGITDEAHDMHTLYIFTLLMALAVFVLVEGGILYAIIRFRKRSDALPTQTHGSTIVEFVWTGIPVLIVIALFTYSFIVLRDVEHKSKAADMTVEITGFQFQWQADYKMSDLGRGSDPNNTKGITIIGTAKDEPTIVIPVGEPVEFRLKSNDVIHSFYVRDFLYKLDVIPGRDNKFTVTAREEGTFNGQCAELCGLNHALMRFHLEVKSRAEFDKWAAEKSAASNAAAAAPAK